MNEPRGGVKSVCLPRKETRSPSAKSAATPRVKSQFEVWGATMMTNFGSSVIAPSNRHLAADNDPRPMTRETTLPRLETLGANGGTRILFRSGWCYYRTAKSQVKPYRLSLLVSRPHA